AAAMKAGKIEFTAAEWKQIESLCAEHIVWRQHERAYPKAADVRKTLSRIDGLAEKLLKTIETALSGKTNSAEKAASILIDSGLSSSGLDLPRFTLPDGEKFQVQAGPMGQLTCFTFLLRLLRQACEQGLERADSDGGKPGPDSSSANTVFIIGLARLFRRKGGRPTAYWDDASGMTRSLFVDFVWEIYAALPKPYRPPSQDALGSRIERVNRHLRKEKGKTLCEYVEAVDASHI
ncbi:MAG: hypothetical protein D6722_07210, partial [Bacteroidetes bacterium]